MDSKSPKLRTVNKSVPAYILNKFPEKVPYNIGERLIYILATRGETDLEGKEWEQIFAHSIEAEWKPSNVGLDDIVLGNTAWGAKSVKHKKPTKQKSVRLISGRNDLQYSFDYVVKPGTEPEKVGAMVLDIYNERVSKIRETYKHLRTVVLIRSHDLTEFVLFEFETIRYDPDLYTWEWNASNNLVGYNKRTGKHKFTWQSGGKQFTIVEDIPNEHTILTLKRPELISKEYVFDKILFDKSWIKIQQTI